MKKLLVGLAAGVMIFGTSAMTGATMLVTHDTIDSLGLAYSEYVLGPTGKWGDPTLGTEADLSWGYLPEPFANAFGPLYGVMGSSAYVAVENAFDSWASVAGLSFNYLEYSYENLQDGNVGNDPDILLGGLNWDGPGDTLAFAFYPNQGWLGGNAYFDWEEDWRTDGTGGYDFESVVLHELGHSLGLDHSPVSDSVMYPYYTGIIRALTADDIAGMQELYGSAFGWEGNPVPEPTTMLLLGSGFLGLVGIRRKLKK